MAKIYAGILCLIEKEENGESKPSFAKQGKKDRGIPAHLQWMPKAPYFPAQARRFFDIGLGDWTNVTQGNILMEAAACHTNTIQADVIQMTGGASPPQAARALL